MTKTEMMNTYHNINGATAYIFGYVDNGVVYMTQIIDHFAEELTTYEQASRGAGMGIRLRIRKAHKVALHMASVAVGTTKDFLNTKYNKGEVFEKLVTEYYGQEWHKDNTPFTECGDININGVEVQIKFDGATFTNERTLTNLLARLG